MKGVLQSHCHINVFVHYVCLYVSREKFMDTIFCALFDARCKFYAAFSFLLSEIPQSWAVK